MRKAMAAAMCLALAAAIGGCASKKKAYSSVDEVFVTYDNNKDGVITKEEFIDHWHDKQKAATAWQRVDAKNNGFVDRALANEQPLDVWSQVESNDLP